MVADARAAQRLLPADGEWQALALCTLGTALRLRGEFVDAKVVLDEALERAAERAPGVAALCLTQLSWLAVVASDWHHAESEIRRGRLIIERSGLTRTPAALGIWVTSALLSARFGDKDIGSQYAERAQACAPSQGLAPVVSVESRILLAKTFILLKDLPATRRELRSATLMAAAFPRLDVLTRRLGETRLAVDSAAVAESASIPLTLAEMRVLRYLPTHLSFQAIGRELTLSANTIKTHAVSVYRKLDVCSRADAVRRAQEQGLLPVGERPAEGNLWSAGPGIIAWATTA
jgi:LuxR family maltose regulon positive regulatory protein